VITLTCRECESPFASWPCRQAMCCSMKCRDARRKQNTPKFSRVCAACGGAFTIYTDYVNKGRGKFCSKSCSNRRASAGRPSVRKNVRDWAAHTAWRRSVFARDDFTCQTCGQRGGALEADHIKPYSLFVEERWDVNNGRTLCRPCHRLTPTWGGRVKQHPVAQAL